VVRQYFDEKTGTTAAPNTRLEFATSWRGTANSRLRREFGGGASLGTAFLDTGWARAMI
jgi:hypothetical protein